MAENMVINCPKDAVRALEQRWFAFLIDEWGFEIMDEWEIVSRMTACLVYRRGDALLKLQIIGRDFEIEVGRLKGPLASVEWQPIGLLLRYLRGEGPRVDLLRPPSDEYGAEAAARRLSIELLELLPKLVEYYREEGFVERAADFRIYEEKWRASLETAWLKDG